MRLIQVPAPEVVADIKEGATKTVGLLTVTWTMPETAVPLEKSKKTLLPVAKP